MKRLFLMQIVGALSLAIDKKCVIHERLQRV